MNIGYLNAFSDNYIWFIQENKDLVVIDPGESAGVLEYLKQNNLNLKAILLTHDHHDHMGGVAELLKHKTVPVYGKCSIATHSEDKIHLSDNIAGSILATPGHTTSSLCFLMSIANTKHLFCGDTLFAAGCGRVFTGDFNAMFHSLNQLKALDSSYLVYPGHEYTLKNLAFAQSIEPDNLMIKQRIQQESHKWKTLNNTLPVTMAIEQQTNPFFRCDDLNLVDAVSNIMGKKLKPGLECFIQLRELRNCF